MTPELQGYQERLQAELDALITAIAQSEAAAGTVELDQTCVGRLSRMDAMQQQAMARNAWQRYSLRRRQVEAALARVTAGTYGHCCRCREELETERLDTDPAVVFCTDCATGRERR